MKKETAQIIFENGKEGRMLQAIADVVGKEIIVHKTGDNSAADVVCIGGDKCILSPRLTDDDAQNEGPWSMSYAQGDDGRVIWVWIGHKVLGPCYQSGTNGKWLNCYSHGNFGKNQSSGGTWSSAPKDLRPENGYASLSDCVAGRKTEIEKALASDVTAHKIFLHYAATPAISPVLI